ncbi:unnamed protein product [Schistosoma turkestanicum]|nr:unnamed protein product [Schistosoma turkestanicum]
MVDHKGHDMHKSNQNTNIINTSITNAVNDISTSNTISIGNNNNSNNISTNRLRDDNNLDEDETDEAEKTNQMNDRHVDVPHNTNIHPTRYPHQTDHHKSHSYDDNDSKNGIVYQKLDSFKKSMHTTTPTTATSTTTTTTTNNRSSTTTTITTPTIIPTTTCQPVKLHIHNYYKENVNNLELSKDETMHNLAKRTLAIGIPGLHPSNHKTLFIFSEENAIRKYSKIIIEWGYPFFFFARVSGFNSELFI